MTSIFGRTFGQDQRTTEEGYEAIASVFKDVQSIPRPCMPEDIAKVALWLAGDGAGYVNGAAINVDGGFPDGLSVKEETVERMGDALGIEIPRTEKPSS